MNKARIEELVQEACYSMDCPVSGIGRGDAIRAALLACAREAYEDAAKQCEYFMGPIELYNPDYRHYFRCIERIRSRAAELEKP